MTIWPFRTSRRSLTVVVAMVGVVSLAIGANAALSKRTLDVVKAIGIAHDVSVTTGPARIALVIGNGHYPDANSPLAQPINDARALTGALRHNGFDVDVVEDATKGDISRSVAQLQDKVKPGSIVMLFFGGYGVQSGRQSYMIPVDAAIWKESDVRRDGISVEAVMDSLQKRGAQVKLAIIDASRRNPYERRFRAFSHGLAPINLPDNSLIMSSTTPGKVADDSKGPNSVLVTELLNNLNSQSAGAETLFNRTRIAISRATSGEQVPSVSSSLLEDVAFRSGGGSVPGAGS